MDTQLLSLKEARARLGLGRSTLFELISEGRLRSVKIGARRLVPEAAIGEFIESLK